MPIHPLVQLGRRAFLAGSVLVAGAVATGCDNDPDPAPAPTTSPAPVDPLAAVLARHVALRDLYAGAIAARPSLAPRLTGLRAEVDQHVAALAAAMAQHPPTSISASAASSASAGNASVGASAGPASSSAAPIQPTSAAPQPISTLLAELRKAEDAAGVELAELVTTVSPPRAPLIGSIAASCACHLVLLT